MSNSSTAVVSRFICYMYNILSRTEYSKVVNMFQLKAKYSGPNTLEYGLVHATFTAMF